MDCVGECLIEAGRSINQIVHGILACYRGAGAAAGRRCHAHPAGRRAGPALRQGPGGSIRAAAASADALGARSAGRAGAAEPGTI